ncbi:nucleotidyltransferase family protein [Mucilaginibacter flavidus]|uniref:nucleotidyltransferase family protein n=1 Tax=Mucilaginibacter flavidus TaxID=2949309 RepID=UPI0020920B3B|nr:nucleotidyltransferase family protein [Mucilaginibacter flavidus]MCO5949292.1 nucleotidyltransferase family protein [Mucilaginibacter flavidus]
MIKYQEHIIQKYNQARVALKALDELPLYASRTIFIIDESDKMAGTVSDGDIRRGLLNGLEISQPIELFMNTQFKFLYEGGDNVDLIKAYRKADIHLIPVLDHSFHLVQILDLKKTKTILPIAALIVAGGRGERLKPFTDLIPKPMLTVGDKSILEHNIDRLISYGISEFYISVKYLKEQIMDYFGDGSAKSVHIHYIEEEEPLGTLGALSLIDNVGQEDILVMNSDLLTNIDFEDFYNFYKKEDATMALASIPYIVNVPYAVLETKELEVVSFAEKPTYTYYSNGGIYLLKFELKRYMQKGVFYNATDLMDKIILEDKFNLMHYPLLGYWLDIGKHQDYIKAQEDIKHIRF